MITTLRDLLDYWQYRYASDLAIECEERDRKFEMFLTQKKGWIRYQIGKKWLEYSYDNT
jgi:hypothetical protein